MGNINPNPFTTRPEIEGMFGIDRSWHDLAQLMDISLRIQQGEPTALHKELVIWRFQPDERPRRSCNSRGFGPIGLRAARGR